MKRKTVSCAIVVSVLITGSWICLEAQFGGGSGVSWDPWQVETAEHLNNVRDFISAYFVQTADIDLSPDLMEDEEWYDGEFGFEPIGTIFNPFGGSYNGNGFVISNLTINRSERERVGLFGHAEEASLVRIGLIDADIRGRMWVGSLVGRIEEGSVSHSFHENGVVRGESRVGGLIGLALFNTEVSYSYSTADAYGEYSIGSFAGFISLGCILSNCYATGKATGSDSVGGLAGIANLADGNYQGYIQNSYTTAKVNCDSETSSGGLIGRNVNNGTIINSYWNIESSGRETGGENVINDFGRTTADMIQLVTYNTWDFNDVWEISDNTYPYLRWQEDTPRDFNYPAPYDLKADENDDVIGLSWQSPSVGEPQSYNVYRNRIRIGSVEHPVTVYNDGNIENNVYYQYYVTVIYREEIESGPSNKVEMTIVAFAGGSGTVFDPYEINEVAQLMLIHRNLNSHFRQTEDLDLSGVPVWTPIGRYTDEFRGSYDGNNYTISNLTIERIYLSYIGFFGNVEGAVIKNVHLENIKIKGKLSVGGLVGRMRNSTLSGCTVNGSISHYEMSREVGGLVGSAISSSITDCRFSGSINGDNYVGGLVGGMTIRSLIMRCYASGQVRGVENIGGLVGRSSLGDMFYNYSTANVEGNHAVGGLIGNAHRVTITHCYSTGSVRGTGRNVGGLIGTKDTITSLNNCYWNTEISGQEMSDGGTPKTTAEMIRRNTYQGWRFDTVWSIEEGLSYPYLQWQETILPHNIPGPYSLAVDVGNQFVNLTWEITNALQPVSYNIYRDGNLVANVEYPTANYSDEQLENFVRYKYYVTAVYENQIESGPSNILIAIPFNFDGGNGSANNPYLVSTAEQLDYVRYFLDGHFVQTRDIDLGVEPYNRGEGWIPIGDTNNRFSGLYDGDGYFIKNLYMDRYDNSRYQSLFGWAEGAEFKNIGLENVHVRGSSSVAGLVSYATNTTVKNSFCTGLIESNGTAGGLIDSAHNVIILNSFASVDVNGPAGAGGLVGRISSESSIYNSYAAGSVRNIRYEAGGLVGNIFDCTVENCYSTARVFGTDRVGGLVGRNSGTVTNSYWNIETSGQEFSEGGEGKYTIEMIYPYQGEIYSEWDFDEFWGHDYTRSINNGYPYPRWQKKPYPDIASNPQPEDKEIDVALELGNVSWDYVVTIRHNKPIGFRVYMNTTGEFGENDDYEWVDYIEEVESYYCADILPGQMKGLTDYYWKVVPTTIAHNRNSKDRVRRQTDKTSQRYGQDSDLSQHRNDAKNVPVWSFATIDPTNVEANDVSPLTTKLNHNHPNPFNPETTIGFSLRESGQVSIKIFNIKGQRVTTIVDNELEAGYHSAIWNGKDNYGKEVSSGVYLYLMETEGEYRKVKRMLFLK